MSAQLHTVVVGGGWAGLGAAISAIDQGHQVTVLEASRHWGGRARSLDFSSCGHPLDNGQHILIGAYTHTLSLMERLGIPLQEVLYRQPLDLRFANGRGLHVPSWAQGLGARLGLLAAVAQARGWLWADKWQFLSTAAQWQRQGFTCKPKVTVEQLSAKLPDVVVEQLIEPLCLAALNTPIETASGQVFLTVLRDALLGKGHKPFKSSDLLLPRVDLGQLLPQAATHWLAEQGGQLHTAQRVTALERHQHDWVVHTEQHRHTAQRVILACPASDAARLVEPFNPQWAAQAQQLKHMAIGTVYVRGRPTQHWPHPMVALQSNSMQAPAQFAFNRSRLFQTNATSGSTAQPIDEGDNPLGPIEVASPPKEPSHIWALVASNAQLSAKQLQSACMWQAHEQLGLSDLEAIRTVVEKRATFASTAGLLRPAHRIFMGLFAAADYVENPYPATLEGALRNSLSQYFKN
jgi:hydroxysqualene dehydroxylase